MNQQRKANQKIGAVTGLSAGLISVFFISSERYQESAVELKALYFIALLIAAWISGFLTEKYLKRNSNVLGVKELALTGLISGGAIFSIFLILYSFIQLLR
jgi:hypothetical protein